jgi:ATP-dependent RNA helicase DeaD
MFSATVPKAIAKLAESYQKNAVRIATSAEQKQHVDIEYRALMVSTSDRENAIINVLRYYEAKTALVFCSTRAAVNHMTARFNNRGFSVVALSGELSQNERTHALQAMRDGRARVLIATDVAARGIDLPNLELVIHADLPTNPETLLHRSGRTGRAGRKGVSVLVVPGNARRKAERILQGANIRAEWARPPSADEILRRDDERLLADPTFEDAVGEEEKPFVAELLARHGAEKVAAAFVRLYRGGRSAPEELIETGPITPGKDTPYAIQPRDDFKDGRWFKLSVGRKQSAEPRWLIPLLCRIGSITKREIGAIKMMQEETLVELAGNCVDGFLAKIGPEGNLENGITMKAMEGKPDFASAAFKRDYEKDDGERVPYKDRNPYAKKPTGEKKAYGDKKPWADKKDGGERKPFGDKKPYGDKKPFGDKKPWAPRAGDQAQPAARPVKTFDQKRAEKSSEQVSLEAADREVWSSGPGKKDYGSPKPAKPAFDKPKTDKPKAKRQNAKNRAE